jgi:hypothetical protein
MTRAQQHVVPGMSTSPAPCRNRLSPCSKAATAILQSRPRLPSTDLPVKRTLPTRQLGCTGCWPAALQVEGAATPTNRNCNIAMR